MEVIVRTAVMYLFLLVTLRLTTRRVSRSMTPLDMVVLFLFGGLAGQAILGQDRSITNSLLAVGTVSAIHLSINMLKLHFPIIGRLTEGTPVVVYEAGEWDHEKMKRLRIYQGDILIDVRQNGLGGMDKVSHVVVEPNGGISIIKKTD
jgi:uncharacterized membrane protein YcaP (DUF421 family)